MTPPAETTPADAFATWYRQRFPERDSVEVTDIDITDLDTQAPVASWDWRLNADRSSEGSIQMTGPAFGDDPHAPDVLVTDPMVYAAARGYGRMVGALLDAGVDVNARYGNALTALIWAAGHTNDAPETDAERRRLLERLGYL